MAMSMGHSSSAYSLEVVYPSGSEMAADRMIACQPQNTKEAGATKQPDLTGALHHVEGGGHQGAAAKCEDHRIGVQGTQTAVRQPGVSKLRAGQINWAAINTPTDMPTIPQTIVMTVNWRTTV
jgi:hypothetical protein